MVSMGQETFDRFERLELLQSYAGELDGNQYGEEGNADLFRRMKADRVVAVFGYSDDLLEFRGAIDDYGYREEFLTKAGLLDGRRRVEPGPEVRTILEENFVRVHADVGVSTRFQVFVQGPNQTPFTPRPLASFKILDDNDVYCTGIVFCLDDC